MMKKIIITFAILVLAGSIYLNSNETTFKPVSPANIEKKLSKHEDIFKNDLREAILSFADETTPADSLYMPDFLK